MVGQHLHWGPQKSEVAGAIIALETHKCCWMTFSRDIFNSMFTPRTTTFNASEYIKQEDHLLSCSIIDLASSEFSRISTVILWNYKSAKTVLSINISLTLPATALLSQNCSSIYFTATYGSNVSRFANPNWIRGRSRDGSGALRVARSCGNLRLRPATL